MSLAVDLALYLQQNTLMCALCPECSAADISIEAAAPPPDMRISSCTVWHSAICLMLHIAATPPQAEAVGVTLP